MLIAEYSSVPDNFALHWNLSTCSTQGQFNFWDKFLDGMASKYFSRGPRYIDIGEIIANENEKYRRI
jgi:hypothetical protein